ncbi:MoaD/ThiS family protein [Methanotorris formicicus]|uniref:Thiamine S protein n=1 Tax=Methanotorris formicicus Mc-S-70 TaxID=647171 RepID=H1KZV7_9EURY|nr:MoaD/ThiS family protein [Methanotorris formicicus]EHP85563.1 thiamine S protein [Methanotorris formicicus Mc-S-70]
MELIIKLFAKYRELYGGEIKITIDKNEITLKELLNILNKNSINIKDDFYQGKAIISINCDVVDSDDVVVKASDEIVIYPPVSGG